MKDVMFAVLAIGVAILSQLVTVGEDIGVRYTEQEFKLIQVDKDSKILVYRNDALKVTCFDKEQNGLSCIPDAP